MKYLLEMMVAYSMRVLALDPGYDRLGVAVIEQCGDTASLMYSACIETSRSQAFSERLHTLGSELELLIENYEPNIVALETLFFNKNQKTAMGVAQVRGVIIYLAKKHRCSVAEFSPQAIKIAVTGYGKSDKKAIIDMVKRLILHVPDKALDDEYDAIATGITALASHRFPISTDGVADRSNI
jgi:crossover junction endodeoxyribonuclease RuvC